MKKKPLSQTNPFLKDPKAAREAFCQSVITSSAIEGIHVSRAELLGRERAHTRLVKRRS